MVTISGKNLISVLVLMPDGYTAENAGSKQTIGPVLVQSGATIIQDFEAAHLVRNDKYRYLQFPAIKNGFAA
jgi:hypothetical protein